MLITFSEIFIRQIQIRLFRDRNAGMTQNAAQGVDIHAAHETALGKVIAETVWRDLVVYIHTIDRMKRYEDQLCGQGVSCVSVWSTHNQDHTMNEEQLSVRQHILDREEIPPQYDVLLINASSETSINIRGEV